MPTKLIFVENQIARLRIMAKGLEQRVKEDRITSERVLDRASILWNTGHEVIRDYENFFGNQIQTNKEDYYFIADVATRFRAQAIFMAQAAENIDHDYLIERVRALNELADWIEEKVKE